MQYDDSDRGVGSWRKAVRLTVRSSAPQASTREARVLLWPIYAELDLATAVFDAALPLAFPLRLPYMPRHSTGGFYAAPAQGSAPVARFASPFSIRRGSTGQGQAPWLCQISPCASCSSWARISATSRTAGTRRWRATSTARENSIHIIDLAQTVPLLHQALKAVSDTVSKGGRVLFVGTKRQASDEIASAAKRSAQYFVNARWLGGMLTNWKTISASISRSAQARRAVRRGREGPHQERAPHDVA